METVTTGLLRQVTEAVALFYGGTGLDSTVEADRDWQPTILAEDVRPGDVIGLGPELGLRVDHIDFDGTEGLLAGRIQCDAPVDGRHGPLRPNQPYATVVYAGSELRWLS